MVRREDADDSVTAGAPRHQVRGQGLLLESKGNYVDAPGKMVAAIGVHDLLIVDTPDALLVARRDCAQDVSRVVKWLEERRREDLL